MINVKDRIYSSLAEKFENVTDSYPQDWAEMPAIQYVEEENKVSEYTDMEEQMSYVRYRVDIWDKKTTSDYALLVDQAIAGLGLKRIQCMDVEDPSGLKHKQLRYEMIIDVNTQQVYHQS